jgi:hypothetical protein
MRAVPAVRWAGLRGVISGNLPENQAPANRMDSFVAEIRRARAVHWPHRFSGARRW